MKTSGTMSFFAFVTTLVSERRQVGQVGLRDESRSADTIQSSRQERQNVCPM